MSDFELVKQTLVDAELQNEKLTAENENLRRVRLFNILMKPHQIQELSCITQQLEITTENLNSTKNELKLKTDEVIMKNELISQILIKSNNVENELAQLKTHFAKWFKAEEVISIETSSLKVCGNGASSS